MHHKSEQAQQEEHLQTAAERHGLELYKGSDGYHLVDPAFNLVVSGKAPLRPEQVEGRLAVRRSAMLLALDEGEAVVTA
jgi:hypothetical protein